MPATPPPAPDLPGPDPGPLGGAPIALSPATFARHEAAARFVESMNRVWRPPLGRTRRPASTVFCRGSTTGAISAAVVGGADGSGPVTITYPDGTTESITAYNRSTTGFASGKNCVLFWVPEVSQWYGLYDC